MAAANDTGAETFDRIAELMPRRRLNDGRAADRAESSASYVFRCLLPGARLRAPLDEVALAIGFLHLRASVALDSAWCARINPAEIRAVGAAMTWCESVPSTPLFRFVRFWHEGWRALASGADRERFEPGFSMIAEERVVSATNFFTLAAEALAEVVEGGLPLVEKLLLEGAFDVCEEDFATHAGDPRYPVAGGEQADGELDEEVLEEDAPSSSRRVLSGLPRATSASETRMMKGAA